MRFPGAILVVTDAYGKREDVQVDRLIHNVDRLLAAGVFRLAATGRPPRASDQNPTRSR
jgi:hypothetical protein